MPGLQQALPDRRLLGEGGHRPGVHAVAEDLRARAEAGAQATSRKGIKDPELREKVTPHFAFGCKRVLISNDYYPALAADNVDLVTDPIAKVTGSSIVTADGTEREIDVLVVATGFYTTELPIAEHVVGKHGLSLADQWRDSGMTAYKGTTIPNFPNLFFIVGPNVGLGHSSMVLHDRVAGRLHPRRPAGPCARAGTTSSRSTRPRPTATTTRLQGRMKRTVWSAGGCDSWYLDAHGKNTTLWPRSTLDFRRRLASFDADGLHAEHGRPARAGPRGRPRMKTLDDKVVVDHRRRLRHRPRARGQPGPSRRAARAVRRRRGRARRDRRAGREGRRAARSAATALDVADRDAMARYALDVVAAVRPGQRGRQQRRRLADRRLHRPRVRRHRLDRRRELLGRRPRHQGVPAAPDRLGRRPRREPVVAVRPDLDAGPVDLQRHQVRRPRHDRGAARGDAHRRPPGRRHLRAPRRHQDRHRPQLPGLRQGGQGGDRRSSSTRSSPG